MRSLWSIRTGPTTAASISGCREPHLPLELASCGRFSTLSPRGAVLRRSASGARQFRTGGPQMGRGFRARHGRGDDRGRPIFSALCAPELRVPCVLLDRLGGVGGRTVASGPHGLRHAPRRRLRKLRCAACRSGARRRGAWHVLAMPRRAGRACPATAMLRARRGGSLRPFQAVSRFTRSPAFAGRETPRVARPCPSPPPLSTARSARRRAAEVAGLSAPACPSRSAGFCAKMDFRDSYRRRVSHR